MYRFIVALIVLMAYNNAATSQDYPGEEYYIDSLQFTTLHFIAGNLFTNPPGSIIPQFQAPANRKILYELDRMYVGEGDIYNLLVKNGKWNAGNEKQITIPTTLPQGYDFVNIAHGSSPGYDSSSHLFLYIFRPFIEGDKNIIEVHVHSGGLQQDKMRALIYCIFNKAGKLINYHYLEYTD